MITYVCNSDFGKHGAVGSRTYHVAKAATKRGYCDGVISRGNKTEIPSKKFNGRTISLIRSGVQQYILPNYKAHEINRRIFERYAITQLDKDMSGKFLHVYDYLPELISEAKKKGAKVILDTQMGFGMAARIVLRDEYSFYGLELSNITDELKSLVQADYIICASKFVFNTFANAGINKKILKIVNHGVDTEKFKPHYNNRDKPKFLYAGLVEPRKGIRYMLDAFRGLDAELIVAGRVNKIMSGKMDIPDNVKFVGHVDLVEYFNDCDVFVFPSLFESSAKVLYEAMASGLPVITTPNAGPIFRNREAGFVVQIKNSEAIRNAVQYFLDNPKEVKRVGIAARKKVLNRSWEQYGEDVCNIYEQTVEDEI